MWKNAVRAVHIEDTNVVASVHINDRWVSLSSGIGLNLGAHPLDNEAIFLSRVTRHVRFLNIKSECWYPVKLSFLG